MSAGDQDRGLVGIFAHEDAFLDGLRRVKEAGIAVGDVFTPVPVHGVEELLAPGKSPVRFLTLAGGIAGMVGGLALALLTALVWNLIVAGKPVTAVVPFIVVGFEGTILLGALATLLGLLVFARLPFRRFPSAGYRGAFSKDRFGVWIPSASEESEGKARALLTEAGAEAVETTGPERTEAAAS